MEVSTMSINEIDNKVQELRELRRMAEELQAEMDTITDEIKQHMDANHMETVLGLDYKISYKTVTSSRIDTAALKKELPDIAQQFSKTTTARRFIVA
jgi:predicted phage-related endonuclease